MAEICKVSSGMEKMLGPKVQAKFDGIVSAESSSTSVSWEPGILSSLFALFSRIQASETARPVQAKRLRCERHAIGYHDT
jgi:hypothetical protein